MRGSTEQRALARRANLDAAAICAKAAPAIISRSCAELSTNARGPQLIWFPAAIGAAVHSAYRR